LPKGAGGEDVQAQVDHRSLPKRTDRLNGGSGKLWKQKDLSIGAAFVIDGGAGFGRQRSFGTGSEGVRPPAVLTDVKNVLYSLAYGSSLAVLPEIL
jgi:hypothetical protein